MVSAGLQDWTRTAKGIAPILDLIGLQIGISPTFFATLDVSQYSSLVVIYTNPDVAVFSWLDLMWDDQAPIRAVPLAQRIVAGPGSIAALTVPVMGTWMQPTATSNVAGGAQTKLLIYGTSSELTPNLPKTGGGVLITDDSAYGAGANKTFDTGLWYTGPATFSIYSLSGNVAAADIQLYDPISFSFKTYATIGVLGNHATTPVVLYVPPTALRVVVFNDGGAQTIRTFVAPAPLFGS